MATIQDIARISGYSIGTVSRVINNRADVSEEARSKIEAVIREQHYQPNSNARMLRQSISSDIAIIVRGVSNIFLQSILEKIQIRVGEHGESASVQFVEETEDEVEAALKVVQQQKPKGLIFIGGSVRHFREEFSNISLPSVMVAIDAEELGFENLSSFSVDDRDAASRAVRELVSNGHRRIGVIGGYPDDVTKGQSSEFSALRIQGAAEELERSGIAFDPQRDHEPCPFSAQGGYDAAKRLLSRTPDLTGIFAISDSVALGAIRALRDMGLRVPEDMSVVGFDGVVYSRYSIPRLATIKQDTEALARKSVDDLLMRVSYEGSAVHEKIPYLYVNGESVARPRE